jgi:hypothetical protein
MEIELPHLIPFCITSYMKPRVIGPFRNIAAECDKVEVEL